MRNWLAVALALGLAACGGSSSVVGPVVDPVPSSTPPAALTPPVFWDGYFTSGRSSGSWPAGSVEVIVPSWGEPAATIADDIVRGNIFVFVSAHHCFGNAPETWEACWSKTREWFAPVEKTGRLIGIYVIDEPLHNGIARSQVDAALARVRADGYETMMAETYNRYRVSYRGEGYAPAVDYFGLTAYYDKLDWVADEYRANPRLNIVFASSAAGPEWEALARDVHARGIFRWSLDMGAADLGHTYRLGFGR